MKKLLMTAFVFLASTASSYAVTDERIFEVIKSGIGNTVTLCEKLGQLPHDDLERLGKFIGFGEPSSETQKAIRKFLEEHKDGMKVDACVSSHLTKSTW